MVVAAFLAKPKVRIMEKNIGDLDRAIRGIVGVALAAAYMGYVAIPGVPTSYPLNLVVLVIALIALATSISGFSPLYRYLKVSTAPKAVKPKGKKK